MPMKSAWCAARFCTIFICTIGTTVPTSPTGTALSTPLIARYNADAVFQLNNKERNIIQTHMWPLTITQLPRCREACLVCLADKMSSSWETLMERRAKREASHAARS